MYSNLTKKRHICHNSKSFKYTLTQITLQDRISWTTRSDYHTAGFPTGFRNRLFGLKASPLNPCRNSLNHFGFFHVPLPTPSLISSSSALPTKMIKEKPNQKVWGEGEMEREGEAPEMLAVLFMKALPATKETNYLLTMWNRILFTRLRFPLLFKWDFSTLPFISSGIIISISQSQSLLKQRAEKKRTYLFS